MGIGQDPVSSEPPAPTSRDKSGPSPIGVPEEYKVPRIGHNREEMGDVRFRRGSGAYLWEQGIDPYDDPNRITYYTGDEYIPANWPATQIWTLQQALAKVGLLRGTFSRSTWDQTTRSAYSQLLGLANAQGIDANTALQQLLSSVDGTADGGSGQWTVDENGNVVPAGQGQGPPPLVTRTTDPAALRQTFRKAVIEMLGEGWSQEEIDKMVAAYNQVEIQRQTQAHNATYGIGGQEGGNIVDIPSPEAFIEAEVTKKDPVGVQTAEALDFTNEFMQVANSPAWGIG